eukprot:gnl/MRDRNA2_/MRDRNA2_28841_c0_seq1.p1 gnl/MRDRNA2_/MRDRNA2_28841_c0~~gnl/MRDRNA2_/MRDRNA2_28841_c0_seq1.p1  ORF type:complete len:437 (-),score=141.06 gnl/MRDRNA2_/MRDRNA2_28841_c0_seq1:167-1477(-)
MFPKNELQQVLQKKLGQPLTKGAIEYKTEEKNGGFVTTLVITCDGGAKVMGTKCADQKEAENSAAQKAVAMYANKGVAATPKKTTEKKAPASQQQQLMQAMAQMLANGNQGSNGNQGAKQMLQAHLQAKLKAPLTKGGITYETTEVTGGFQSTVTLVCDGGTTFTGAVAADKKTAETNAAAKALGKKPASAKAKAKAAPAPQTNQTPNSGKAQLQALLQKKLGKPLVKGSIEYTTEEENGTFKTTVSFPCDDGRSFVGGVAKTKQQAELNAVQKAVGAYNKEVGGVSMKRKNGDAPQPPAKKAKGDAQSNEQSTFCELNSLVAKINRTSNKGDINVEKEEVATEGGGKGFQCTITISSLSGYESTQFTGVPGDSVKEAKNNAAQEALTIIKNDANLMQMIESAAEAKKQKDQSRPSQVKWLEKLEQLKAERESKKA